MFSFTFSRTLRRALLIPATMMVDLALSAQSIEPAEGITFPTAGKLRARAASEITASSWSVGGETLDRRYADYEQYKGYLGPLGAKSIRLQAGWARTESERGKYDWAWLDAVVDDAVAQGVRPWINISYGNLIYEGGGGIGLSDGLPTSTEALAAWSRWTRALVNRYKDRVNEWEIWNEPDHRPGSSVPEYLTVFVPTAEMIRAEQPNSRIYALSLAKSAEFAAEFLTDLRDSGKLDLVDAITVHGYPANPSESQSIHMWRSVIKKFSDKIELRQGETGAPSTRSPVGALKNQDWTELLQSKWNLCRMLTHLGHGVSFNLFTLCDLKYSSARYNGMNSKGLLKANLDQSVAYAKPSYFAAQNVFSFFDHTWQVQPASFTFADETLNKRISRYAFKRNSGDAHAMLLWFGDKPPAASNATTQVSVTVDGIHFTTPAYVDLRTGLVYDIPSENCRRDATGTVFTALPIYDSPILIAEKSTLLLKP